MQVNSDLSRYQETEIEHALSAERFERYMRWADNDRGRAIELYILNVRISEAFYVPLHFLEVALRNRFHAVLADHMHEEWYYEPGFLLAENQQDQVMEAVDRLREEGKPPTPGRVVAALTFGFWTTFTNRPYEPLWRQVLHRSGSRDGRNLSRKDLARPLTRFRKLRNRIAHHEPVLHWNLTAHHAEMIAVTEWLSPVAADLIARHSRFRDVYPAEPIILA